MSYRLGLRGRVKLRVNNIRSLNSGDVPRYKIFQRDF